MGTLTPEEEGHIESVVYFLTEALRAAVENGDSVEQSLIEAPQLSANMTCAEITDRLAAYRRHLRAVWNYEVMLVAKIMRARELAKELRTLEPELKPELDTFRLATVSCADLQELLLPNAQNVFNSADLTRRPGFEFASSAFDGAKADPIAGYRIAGHTEISLLLNACEVLHFALAARYSFEAMPIRAHAEPSAEEPMLLEDEADEGEEAFLLTEFCEMLPEPAASGAEWRAGRAGNPALPN